MSTKAPRRERGKNVEQREISDALSLVTVGPDPAERDTTDQNGLVLVGSEEARGALTVIEPVTDETLRGLVRPEQMGARPVAGIDFTTWLRAVGKIERAGRAWPWIMADLLSYGDETYGEDYAQALTNDPWSYHTEKNMITVARAIPIERRRSELSIGHHECVTSLDEDVQDRLLQSAVDGNWTREQIRDAVRTYKRELVRLESISAPVPEGSLSGTIFVEVGDATNMALKNGAVDVIITSPPYGLDKDEEDTAEGWIMLMERFLAEALRVLSPGGRLALNIPIDTTLGGFRPTQALATQLALDAGFTYAATIIWYDATLNKSVARGSVDSPSAVRVMTPAEAVILLSKGPWKRDPAGKTWDLTHEEWLEWTHGMWIFPGESNPWEGFTAGAFPLELPRRLIKLLSYREDKVLDPFLGSGTTMAAAHYTGRTFLGYDSKQERVDSSKRRLATLIQGPEGETKAKTARRRKAKDVLAGVIETEATNPENVVIRTEPDANTEPAEPDQGDVDTDQAFLAPNPDDDRGGLSGTFTPDGAAVAGDPSASTDAPEGAAVGASTD